MARHYWPGRRPFEERRRASLRGGGAVLWIAFASLHAAASGRNQKAASLTGTPLLAEPAPRRRTLRFVALHLPPTPRNESRADATNSFSDVSPCHCCTNALQPCARDTCNECNENGEGMQRDSLTPVGALLAAAKRSGRILRGPGLAWEQGRRINPLPSSRACYLAYEASTSPAG